ncbi:MAG: hypothetical protein ACTSSP_00410 [Candidatus Asgardarchaeia archaeon]
MAKEIAYLVQTSDYIPKYVKTLEEMGRDVYILSWKKPVEYKNSIFFPNSTCWEGKNKLAEIVPKKYLYYVCLENDLELRIRKDKYPEDEGKNPWQIFDDFLLEYQPAIGTVYYNFINKIEHQTTILLAFHSDAFKVCFPVYTNFDRVSWWWTETCHMLTFFYAFYMYTLHVDKIGFVNKYHGHYDRISCNKYFSKIWKESFLQQIDKDNFKYVWSHFVSDPITYILPKKILPGDYKKMAKNFKDRVDKNHVIWRDNPFINGKFS